ncbi:hypothetical protein CQA38_08445 [Campylobacter sp. MIT 12-5580]|uniref:hypothetical protein n=1 Tax=unclassified Campylobacter TaxID=2593542 RepID=UPI0010F6F9A8|nr:MULTISPECIES: hypothetical protein [unclassified Campylobacter]NDJ28033.1 hypothetical protein [Campylobacter sp. MIT 19-121]NDJ28038.1 hypothetical protein [Campylobacter sp. MIT 19-121]TKX28266.1 hypothetical protein CQA38_08445 [Campylobacter sp. MIT 12-5580]
MAKDNEAKETLKDKEKSLDDDKLRHLESIQKASKILETIPSEELQSFLEGFKSGAESKERRFFTDKENEKTAQKPNNQEKTKAEKIAELQKEVREVVEKRKRDYHSKSRSRDFERKNFER